MSKGPGDTGPNDRVIGVTSRLERSPSGLEPVSFGEVVACPQGPYFGPVTLSHPPQNPRTPQHLASSCWINLKDKTQKTPIQSA